MLLPCEMFEQGFRDHHTYLNDDDDSVCWTCGRIRFAPRVIDKEYAEMIASIRSSPEQREEARAARERLRSQERREQRERERAVRTQQLLQEKTNREREREAKRLQRLQERKERDQQRAEKQQQRQLAAQASAARRPVRSAPPPPPPGMLTMGEAAQYIGISLTKFRAYLRRGAITGKETDAGWLFHRDSLTALQDLSTPW